MSRAATSTDGSDAAPDADTLVASPWVVHPAIAVIAARTPTQRTTGCHFVIVRVPLVVFRRAGSPVFWLPAAR
ncbi:hypothetical protein GCM10022238_17640 [Gordonia hankookensis]